MAGRKARASKNRKQKFENRRNNMTAQKNKKARWERLQRKMQRKAEARGETWSPKYSSLDEQQEAGKSASKKAVACQQERMREERQARQDRKKKADKVMN